MILALIAAAAATACAPVPGGDQLWADPKTRFVLVGENHGTNESPAMFADLVCAASAKHKVVVALEYPPEEQPAIDAFLRSNGDAEARTAFLKSRIWTNSFKDGRSSVAMLNLFEQLRQWKRAGRIQALVAFSDYDLSIPFSQADEGVNRGMARVLERSATAYPGSLVLGYGGSVHMSAHDVMGTAIRSAAGRLPRSKLVSTFVEGDGGWAWQCRGTGPMDCGPHQSAPFGPHYPRGVWRTSEYLLPGFDFIVSTGVPFSASPAALPTSQTQGRRPPK
ncbi:MAG: hypothetical protein ABIQ32_04060 [Sphingomicrobium sp.]